MIDAQIPLGIKAPAAIDPLEAYGRILGIQGKQQEIQNQQDQHQANTAIASENFKRLQQQNAEAQQKAKDQEIIRQAYVGSGGKPDETVSAAIQAGAGPEAVQGLQTHFATLAEHAAKTSADQLTVDKEKNDKFLALHDTALGLDDQQLAQAWPQIYAQIATLDPNAAKSLNPQQPPSKSDILVSRASHQTLGYNLAAETEKRAKAKADEEAAAAARAAKIGDNAQLVSDAETPVKVAQAAQQMGDPGLLTGEQRQQATQAASAAAETAANNQARLGIERQNASTSQGQLSAAQAREAREKNVFEATYGGGVPDAVKGLAPATARAATKEAQKITDEYLKTNAVADNLQSMIDAARSGNKAAGSNLPLVGVETLNAINGIKRINSAEISQYQGAGSLLDSIQGKIGKLASGQPIPADVMKDIEALHKTLRENSDKAAQDRLGGVNHNYGSGFTLPSGPIKPIPAKLSASDVGKTYQSKNGKKLKITAVNPADATQFTSQEVP